MIKTKRNRKWEIPYTVLERRTLCFSSYKNRKLKVKRDELELAEEKRGQFLHGLFCLKGVSLTFAFYLNVQCIENTFRIYILLHIKKHYIIHFCCLILISSKALSVSLNHNFRVFAYQKIVKFCGSIHFVWVDYCDILS